MTIPEADAAVGMSADFIRREIHARRLRARFVGKRYLIGRADLEAWFDKEELAS